jgi:hypothetical protein
MPRHADALACLARLPGSESAKKRAESIVRTITGDQTILDAADDLDVSTQRFHAIRDQALSGLIQALEPRPAGRPPSHPTPIAEADAQGSPRVSIDPAILRECARLRTELEFAFGKRLARKKNS